MGITYSYQLLQTSSFIPFTLRKHALCAVERSERDIFQAHWYHKRCERILPLTIGDKSKDLHEEQHFQRQETLCRGLMAKYNVQVQFEE